jgi:hypothetical protein
VKILIVNRFFGGAQIPTGRMVEDVARLLVEEGHEVVALASTGTYAGAEKRALDYRTTGRQDDPLTRSARRTAPAGPGALSVETVNVPQWMPRALAWLWFTWQARKRIPRMDWDVCVLMTDPPLLPLLAARVKAAGGSVGQCFGRAVEDERLKHRRTETPPHRATRRVAVWLMDLYPEALAASGRIGTGNPIYRWYFEKRQRALSASDLLICLGQTQKERLETKRPKDEKPDSELHTANSIREEGREGGGENGVSVGRYFGRAVGTETLKHRNTEPPRPPLTQRVRTVVVPPWDDRGNIAFATDESLRNLALYAGNLGEAHCFEEVLAAAPHLPADWTIRFAARGAKLSALKEKAKGISHRLTRIDTDGSDRYAPPGRVEKLVPDDLGTRNSPSDKEAAEPEGEGVFSHSRPQGDRQLGELSEAVKLTRMKGRISPGDCADRTKEEGSCPGTPGNRGESLDEEMAEAQEGAASLLVSSSFGLFSSLGAKIEITGYASEGETPELLASARVHLITMSPGWEGIVVPSKLYGCIRTGRPVLFIGPEDADTASEIRAHDWGKVLPSGASGEEVASAILELAARETCAVLPQRGAAAVAKLIQTLATAEQSETKNSKS